MKFRRAVLRGLDGLYNFIGSEVRTNQVELERPITLVHDVHRMVELESGVYFTDTQTLAFPGPGAGTDRISLFPHLKALTLNINPNEWSVWAVNANMGVSATGIFTNASLYLALPTFGAFIQEGYTPLQVCDAVVSHKADGAFGFFQLWSNGEPAINPISFPILCSDQTFFRSVATLSGAGTFATQVIYWAGPKGSSPPHP